jgi:hypothetical protein
LLTHTPSKLSLTSTLDSRSNILENGIAQIAEISMKEISFTPLATNLQFAPACLGAEIFSRPRPNYPP